MKKTILTASAVVALASVPSAAFADLAFNIGGVTDYRYRGISQSRGQPALQGGVDFTAGGFYVGSWASTIAWIDDVGGSAHEEVDFYGGYKGEINKEVSYDVGVLTYYYPGNNLNPSANTTEIYGALTYGPVTVKYSHAVTNTFANPDSKNSGYLEGSAAFDVYEGLTITPHIGYQHFTGPNSDIGSYFDYSLTMSKDFGGIVPSIAVVGTRSADADFYTSPVNGKRLAAVTLVAGIKFTF